MIGTVVLWSTAAVAVAGTAGNAIFNGVNRKKVKENKEAINNNETAIRAVSKEVEGLKKDFSEVQKEFKDMKVSLENTTSQTRDQYNQLVMMITAMSQAQQQQAQQQQAQQQPVIIQTAPQPETNATPGATKSN